MNGTPPHSDPVRVQQTFLPVASERTFLPQTRRARLASLMWTLTWMLLARWTPGWLNVWRVMLLRCFGAGVGASVYIAPSVRVRFPWNLSIGHKTIIHFCVIIDCMGPVKIGTGVRLSQYSHICAGTHEYQDFRMTIHPCSVTIGDDVWVAADAFVGPDVVIGQRTIVGARASVFKDLPPNVIAVGDNAQPIKMRDHWDTRLLQHS